MSTRAFDLGPNPDRFTDGKVVGGLLNHRRRMNIGSVAACLFVPWLLFCAVFAAMTFSIHYHEPLRAYFVVGLSFVFVLAAGISAWNTSQQTSSHDGQRREPTWYAFLFLTCLLAWVMGIVVGDANFRRNIQPFYDISNLNSYPSIDPSKMRGQQVMDAGYVMFTDNAKLDLKRAIGFKNLDLFCVAPITVSSANVSTLPLDSYDFWAVGTNCCTGDTADYRCGDYMNSRAHGGLRFMRDDQRPYFRLAVQQAEAMYGIRSRHPLFFYWVADPMTELASYQDDGFKYYLLGMIGHFAVQLGLVVGGATVVVQASHAR